MRAGTLLSMDQPHAFETLAIHAGQAPDQTTGAVVPPIHQTSTYQQDAVGRLRGGYDYSRAGNPTRTALEECLAALESGTCATSYASGLAAEDTAVRAVCAPGDHVVIPDDAYGGSLRLFRKVLAGWGLSYTPSRSAISTRYGPPYAPRPGSSGVRPPPIRCSASTTSPRWPASPMRRARCSRSTTPSPRRTCSSR